MNSRLKAMVVSAVMAALLCVLAPISLPIGPVPISLATFIIYLMAALTGWKSIASVGLYLLLGGIGLPVFAGWSGGLQALVGPTAGYLLGYLLIAWMVGLAADKWGDRLWVLPVAMMVGTASCYALGTVCFMAATGTSFGAALLLCVVPFFIGDAIKIAAATALALPLRKRLKAAARL